MDQLHSKLSFISLRKSTSHYKWFKKLTTQEMMLHSRPRYWHAPCLIKVQPS